MTPLSYLCVECYIFCLATVVESLSFHSYNIYLSLVGAASQTPKDEGRGPGQPGEILGLKRPYDAMEGGISRGLATRESAASCEGKRSTSL